MPHISLNLLAHRFHRTGKNERLRGCYQFLDKWHCMCNPDSSIWSQSEAETHMIIVSSIAFTVFAGCQPLNWFSAWFQIFFSDVGFGLLACFLTSMFKFTSMFNFTSMFKLASMFKLTSIQAVLEQVEAQSILYIFWQWGQRSTTPRLTNSCLTCKWN